MVETPFINQRYLDKVMNWVSCQRGGCWPLLFKYNIHGKLSKEGVMNYCRTPLS